MNKNELINNVNLEVLNFLKAKGIEEFDFADMSDYVPIKDSILRHWKLTLYRTDAVLRLCKTNRGFEVRKNMLNGNYLNYISVELSQILFDKYFKYERLNPRGIIVSAYQKALRQIADLSKLENKDIKDYNVDEFQHKIICEKLGSKIQYSQLVQWLELGNTKDFYYRMIISSFNNKIKES